MRRISRIERSVDLLRARANTRAPSPYLCHACKQRTASYSTTAPRAAASGPGFTEKLRQRIWGTDNPPGAKDPYTRTGALEQSKQTEQEQEVERQSPATVTTSADYQPADTWHGLQVVGDTAALFRQNWDAEHQFEGFLPPHVMNDTAEITANLRRAIIEVLAQRQAGQTSELPPVAYEEDLTRNVKLGYSESGLTLDFGSQERFEYLVQSLAPATDEVAENESPTNAEEEVSADRSAQDPLESTKSDLEGESEGLNGAENATRRALIETSATSYDEVVASWDPSWLQMPLDNPHIKFAVLKRTLQLTGIRVSDALISSTRNVQGLLSHMVIAPKPRKLVDRLAQKETLMTLPNVNVFAKRITPIDKEKTIGRWKIIEKELEERGLPVTGKYSRAELKERARGSLVQ